MYNFTKGEITMNDLFNKIILTGILISLLIIAFKPDPVIESSPQDIKINEIKSNQVVQLSDNKISIVDTDVNSTLYGEILILEYDEDAETFNLVGSYNYREALFDE